MTNSKRKGKNGELEAAAILREHGFDARRGQQFSGSDDSPDIVHSIPGVHIEVKRIEKLSLYDAMQQALWDAGNKMPVVLHRRNAKPWLAVMLADDFLRLMKERDSGS